MVKSKQTQTTLLELGPAFAQMCKAYIQSTMVYTHWDVDLIETKRSGYPMIDSSSDSRDRWGSALATRRHRRQVSSLPQPARVRSISFAGN